MTPVIPATDAALFAFAVAGGAAVAKTSEVEQFSGSCDEGWFVDVKRMKCFENIATVKVLP